MVTFRWSAPRLDLKLVDELASRKRRSLPVTSRRWARTPSHGAGALAPRSANAHEPMTPPDRQV
eukprot:scaffold452_cov235-Pinguiococcus_pyrenoidosus.AAC.2